MRIRPSFDADADWATAVYNGANPDQPQDVAYTRWIWGLEDADWLDKRYAVELGATPLGWLMLECIVWAKNPERLAGVDAWLDASLHSRFRLDRIFGHVENDAREIGAKVLTTNVRETAPKILAALVGREYVEVGRQRYWELDLARHRERLLALVEEARVRTLQSGIRLLTLAQDDDPDIDNHLYRLYVETRLDMPSTTPWAPWSTALFRDWLDDPHKHRDRFWIARHGKDLAGMSVLAYPQSTIGIAETSWTGVGRKHRGLGLAQAPGLGLGASPQARDFGSGNTAWSGARPHGQRLHQCADSSPERGAPLHRGGGPRQVAVGALIGGPAGHEALWRSAIPLRVGGLGKRVRP